MLLIFLYTVYTVNKIKYLHEKLITKNIKPYHGHGTYVKNKIFTRKSDYLKKLFFILYEVSS